MVPCHIPQKNTGRFFQKTNFPEGTFSRVLQGSCYKKEEDDHGDHVK
jgi:hypothetical protein